MSRRVLGLCASGLLISLSFPSWLTPELSPWTGWLAWVALIPALRALDSATPRDALIAGWLGGFVRWMSTLYWVGTIAEFEAFRIPAWLLFAAVLACFHAGWAWLVARGTPGRVMLVAPAAWIVMEWVQGRIFTGFPWTPLGATLWAWPEVFMWASVVGVVGLAWPIVAFNVMLAVRDHGSMKRSWITGAILVLVAGLAIGARILIERMDPGPRPELRIALLQGAFTETEKWTLPADTQLARYERLAREAAEAAHADVMVWPETATVALIETRGLVPRLAALAQRTGAVQVVGALSQDVELRVFNGAFAVDRTGVTGRYEKNRLVPFGEFIPGWFRALIPVARKLTAGLVDMTPGTGAQPVPLPGGVKAGIMVCYEAVYPDHARRLVAAGAELFINVTNDAWYGRTAATFQHALGPISRAVECGRPVLRCANTGLTLVAFPDGSFARSLALFKPGVHSATIRPSARRTVYSRWGDWPVLVAGLLVLAFAASARRPA